MTQTPPQPSKGDMVTLFSGGGGTAIGGMMAGYAPAFAVEADESIAAVYAQNVSPCVKVARVEDVTPRPFCGVELLTASPPCPSFSQANANRRETAGDLSAAEGVCNWLRIARPEKFLLENVVGYRSRPGRRVLSYDLITACLDELDYSWRAENVNFASHNVPQTRTRLILWAFRSGEMLPPVPAPLPWLGWYDAVCDLLPGLPESQLAPWQMKRLPAEITTLLVGGANTSDVQSAPGVGVSMADEPSRCVATNAGQWRAVLVDGEGNQPNGHAQRGPVCVPTDRPAPPVTTQWDGRARAVLIEGDAAGDRPPTCGTSAEPSFTIKTASGGRVHRALLIDANNGRTSDGQPTIRASEDPSFTITGARVVKHRALLISDQTEASGRLVGVRHAHEPAGTVLPRGGGGSHPRAILPEFCRVVALSPRCLARLQSFPDWYELPASRTLASKVIGNAVPPAGCARLMETL